MLPNTSSPKFPAALKAAREAKGLSYTELAHAAGINPAMPSRYENKDHSCHCVPRESTLKRLNEVLFGIKAPSSSTTAVGGMHIWLGEATVEQIVEELRARGAQKISVEF